MSATPENKSKFPSKLPVFPKYEKLKKYTTISIPDDESVVNILSEQKDILLSDFQFIPPVFSEYVITTDLTTHYTKLVMDELYNYALERRKFQELSKVKSFVEQNKEAFLRETYNGAELCRANLVRWDSEKSFSVLCYDLEKKVLFIYANYDFDENGMAKLSLASAPLCDGYKELYDNDIAQYRNECQTRVLWVLAVSKFLLDYTNKVQYEKVEYISSKTPHSSSPLDKSRKSNDSKTTITLKSRIRRYDISLDDVVNFKKRKYTPIKSSWFVRGYYQHFGKDKVLKYIPPRINKRDPNKLSSPTPNKYIIKK